MGSKKSPDKFLYNFRSFFKYELFDSIYLDFSMALPHMIAIVFALTGIYAFTEQVLWLMILSAAVSFGARALGFMLTLIQKYDRVPYFLNSHKFLIAVAVILFFPVFFLLKPGFFSAVFFSLNASVLLIYVLNIPLVLLPIMFRNTVRYCRRMLRSRRERKEAIEAALDEAGLEKRQVRDIQAVLGSEGEIGKLKFFYTVSFTHGGKEYRYKVYH